MSDRNLQPIEPESAVKMYLNQRDPEVAQKTLENIRNHLNHFVEWCQEEEISDTTDLTGRVLHRYRLYRQEGIAQSTLSINLSSLRKFLRWAESIDAVSEGLDEKVILPSRDPDRDSRDVMLEADDAEEMLNHLRQFQYASRTHALLELMWHCGCRKGTIRGFDLDDFSPRKRTLEAKHRPETDTPLKNGSRGQRVIALDERITGILTDYVEVSRSEKTDDFGRNPLFTTRYGRISLSAIKDACYTMTRPCEYGSCPHNRDLSSCEATDDSQASRCPSSVSPHPVRRGSITHHLLKDVPETAVSDRCDFSPEVLEVHYDERTEHEKAEQRREFIDSL